VLSFFLKNISIRYQNIRYNSIIILHYQSSLKWRHCNEYYGIGSKYFFGKYVAISPRSGAHDGERNLLLSASKGLCCKKRRTLMPGEVLRDGLLQQSHIVSGGGSMSHRADSPVRLLPHRGKRLLVQRTPTRRARSLVSCVRSMNAPAHARMVHDVRWLDFSSLSPDDGP